MKRKKPKPSILPRKCSLVAETAESLREGIQTGVWQDVLPAERKLSEDLQVSRSTLRSALKELERSGWVKVKERRRWIKKRPAGCGADGGQRMVGVISSSPATGMSPSILLVLDVLRRTLAQAGFEMKIHFDRACHSAKPARALQALVGKHPTHVWLLLYSKEQTERWFVRQKLPCLVMGSSRPEVKLPSIDADHRAACRHAGGVLLRKGHRRIALLVPRNVFGGDADSEAGLKEAVAASEGARVQVLRHDGSAAHICSLVDKALAQGNPPTAFVVARAIHTLTLLAHLLRRGKRIPQDVAVISRDDDPFMEAIHPSVTRYTVDAKRYARRISTAARQLAESGMLPASAIRLMPEFLPGGTV